MGILFFVLFSITRLIPFPSSWSFSSPYSCRNLLSFRNLIEPFRSRRGRRNTKKSVLHDSCITRVYSSLTSLVEFETGAGKILSYRTLCWVKRTLCFGYRLTKLPEYLHYTSPRTRLL